MLLHFPPPPPPPYRLLEELFSTTAASVPREGGRARHTLGVSAFEMRHNAVLDLLGDGAVLSYAADVVTVEASTLGEASALVARAKERSLSWAADGPNATPKEARGFGARP